LALATLKSAAAMKAKSITSPKKVAVKKALTRRVPIRKTKEARTLVGEVSGCVGVKGRD
jgi:hypothetical protein